MPRAYLISARRQKARHIGMGDGELDQALQRDEGE
jgi:hypothetical protein